MIKKLFDPRKANYSSGFYKWNIAERKDDIKCLKEEIKVYTKWYKIKLKQEKELYDNRKINRNKRT